MHYDEALPLVLLTDASDNGVGSGGSRNWEGGGGVGGGGTGEGVAMGGAKY